jgi:hypothetical protein
VPLGHKARLAFKVHRDHKVLPGLQGLRDHKGLRAYKAPQVIRVHRARRGLLASQVPLDRKVPLVFRGQRAQRVHKVHRDHKVPRGLQVPLDRKGQLEPQVLRGP